ncbi:MAG: acyl-CoA dehydrogenase [Chloroflexi bacterium]|nr:acyl-CoA dehydrogenase [Chloroflexota bacterium]
MDFRLTDEQQQLVAVARRLAADRFADADTEDGFAFHHAQTLADAGFTGIALPVEDGGQGGGLFDAALVMEAVSEVSPSAGDAVQATNFGAIRQMATFASPSLKQAVLPRLLAGEGLVTVGMSEPEAGSGLTDLRTTARIEGDEVVLDGEKSWNSNGPDATHVVVWCRFGPRTRDIGCVLVPTDAHGFTKGPPERYMSGDRYCGHHMDGCRVPLDNVLIDGDGFRRMMTMFGVERIGNAIRALALAQGVFDMAVEHAKTRQQFGRPLSDFQGLQWKFADMRMRLDAARLLIYRAVVGADQGAPDPAEATIAKCFANEAAWFVANESLQVFGAIGYSTALPIERRVRKIRGWMIAGGSVEILRNRIAEDVFGQRFSQRPPT